MPFGRISCSRFKAPFDRTTRHGLVWAKISVAIGLFPETGLWLRCRKIATWADFVEKL